MQHPVSSSKKRLLKALIENNINISMLVDFILASRKKKAETQRLLKILVELQEAFPYLTDIRQDSNLDYPEDRIANAKRLLHVLKLSNNKSPGTL